MGHLTKLQAEFGKKGLTVLGLTGEDLDMNLRYMIHNDANFGYAVGIGGASGYPHRGIPYSAIIAADGTVAYLGHPGSFSSKDLEALLKKVPKLTAEQQEARAAKMLEFVEKLIADKELTRAEVVVGRIQERYAATESGKKAAARVKEIQTGEFAAEYAAQKELAKLIGGVEKPAEADSKKFQKLVKVLDKKAAEWAEKAPKTAEMAKKWKSLAEEPWK